MFCATLTARAKHLKNVVPNSRRQGISQISRFIYKLQRGWYNQRVWNQRKAWLPTYAFPSMTEYSHEGKTIRTIDRVFCSSARVVARSKSCKCIQWNSRHRSFSEKHSRVPGEPRRAHVAVDINRPVSAAIYLFILWVKATRLLTCIYLDGSRARAELTFFFWDTGRKHDEVACTSRNVLTVWLWVCHWWILDAELCHKPNPSIWATTEE